jgi:hypothetical protein
MITIRRFATVFIAFGIFALIASRLSGIPLEQITCLALAIGPLALLNTQINLARESGSIFINRYLVLFKLASAIMAGALMYGLYRYGRENGFSRTAVFFLVAGIVQAPYYALLKGLLPGEIFLLPFALAGVIIFFYFGGSLAP